MSDRQQRIGQLLARARSNLLEFAVLGLLDEVPMHGYELRKQLNLMLGSFRALSYGSLYPCLKALQAQGWIAWADDGQAVPPHALSGKRAKIVYRITDRGRDHFHERLTESGPSAWEDESFDVRFAFFAHTDADIRLRILEGRRTRLTERLEAVRTSMTRTRERMDDYTLELQRHGLEQVEREVKWLDGLIDTERDHRRARPSDGGTATTHPQ